MTAWPPSATSPGPSRMVIRPERRVSAGRNFARATRRAYAYDVLNFLRFLDGQGVGLAEVRPIDLFDYLDWQTQPKRTAGSTVVRLSERRGAAAATRKPRTAPGRA